MRCALSAILLFVLVTLAPDAHAQGKVSLTFRQYLDEVGRSSLDLAAQRAHVSFAQAQIAVARVFPDPTVTAGVLQYDVGRDGLPTQTITQLNVPLQIGGQRSARTAYAQANLSVAEAELEDTLRALRASAANAYVDALHARLVLARKKKTLESLVSLVSVNEERLRAGDVGEVILLQSRVEASQFRADVLAAEGEVQANDLALLTPLGGGASGLFDRTLVVEGSLDTSADRSFNANALAKRALETRADLVAARRRVSAAQSQIEVARRNRIIDIGIGASWQHSFAVGGLYASPDANTVGLMLTVPLPFSRLYRGELDSAFATERQEDAATRALAVKVEVEVRQAVVRYDASAARVRLYTGGTLHDADQVLEKTLYNYRRGGATLVEVLVAQRTDDQVYLSYFDALAEAAHALVAVEQAVGNWDISF